MLRTCFAHYGFNNFNATISKSNAISSLVGWIKPNKDVKYKQSGCPNLFGHPLLYLPFFVYFLKKSGI